MITSIHFTNFKGLNNYSITIKDLNVLTGPNNNGKSTILDGIRALAGAYRYASRYVPKFIDSPYGKDSYGYEIPDSSIPITLENIQNDYYTEDPAEIKYRFKDGQSLSLILHPNHPNYLFFDTPRKAPKSAKDFRAEFPVKIAVIPTLGPLEVEEEILGEDYVNATYGSRRSPRMFRNYWFYNSEGFDIFRQLVESTWDGMSISLPEKRDNFSKDLLMFCYEERITREISWAGSGFQIWLQLLTHIVNSKDADIIVVDEPEIYLHPDLQHKVLKILKETGARIIVATHSVEIINSVEPHDVVLVDKKNRTAKRINDLEGLQAVSELLGSGQNIQLTRLARGKKILFVEGKDLKLLTKLARIAHKDDVFASGEITVIPIDGISRLDRIVHANWAFSQILGEEIKLSVLLDRDYRVDDEVKIVIDKLKNEVSFVHILKKKEIENYFLVPAAIEKAINDRLEERVKSGTLDIKPTINIETLLKQITEELKSDVHSQLIASQLKHKKAKDPVTVCKEVSDDLDIKWRTLSQRLNIISGKDFVNQLNQHLQNQYRITITYTQIANQMLSKQLDDDIICFFNKLEDFRTGTSQLQRKTARSNFL